MRPSRRMQASLEKDAALRLSRFERVEEWNGLAAGDRVRIAGHRGGVWHFRAFVTNTSNGASWVEVSEIMAAGRKSGRAATTGGSGEGGEVEECAVMSRIRSFRPELVMPHRRPRRRRRAARKEQMDPVQGSLF